jgi:tRNA (guanine6-N2)-methyltransferase
MAHRKRSLLQAAVTMCLRHGGQRHNPAAFTFAGVHITCTPVTQLNEFSGRSVLRPYQFANMPKNTFSESSLYAAEVAPGLEDIAAAEIATLVNVQILAAEPSSGEVEFLYAGRANDLIHLKTVIAVYSVRRYDIPRPKAFLGHQHFQTLVKQLYQSIHLHPAGTFNTLYISAAGSDSSVMQRVKEELAQEAGLQAAPYEGDVWIRIRRGKNQQGWETLVRLSPRPLATRAWRVKDMPGALNASVAHAMVTLAEPKPADTCLNIVCGSGTILIERLQHSTAGQVIGCDMDAATLALAHENITAAGFQDRIRLMQADARTLPLPENSVNLLLADLPFGNLMGSHDDNRTLYPALLAEAGRIAQPEARFVVITHEVKLLDNVVRNSEYWTLQKMRMVTLGGLHPRIFLLVRQ